MKSVLSIITNNPETIQSIKLNTDVNIEIINNIQESKTKYTTEVIDGICNTVELLDLIEFLEKNDYDIVEVPYLKYADEHILNKDYTKIYKTDRKLFNNSTTKLEIDYFYFEKHI